MSNSPDNQETRGLPYKKYLSILLAGGIILLLTTFFILWIAPIMLKNGESIISFSQWIDSWRHLTVISRALIYAAAWYLWPTFTRSMVHRAKNRRLAKLERIADTEKINQEYASIERQVMGFRPKLIGMFVAYELVMLYSIFS